MADELAVLIIFYIMIGFVTTTLYACACISSEKLPTRTGLSLYGIFWPIFWVKFLFKVVRAILREKISETKPPRL